MSRPWDLEDRLGPLSLEGRGETGPHLVTMTLSSWPLAGAQPWSLVRSGGRFPSTWCPGQPYPLAPQPPPSRVHPYFCPLPSSGEPVPECVLGYGHTPKLRQGFRDPESACAPTGTGLVSHLPHSLQAVVEAEVAIPAPVGPFLG